MAKKTASKKTGRTGDGAKGSKKKTPAKKSFNGKPKATAKSPAPKGTKKAPKGTKKEPKGTKKEPKGTKKEPKGTKAPDLSMIAAELRSLARPITELTLDPKNAKQHGERNLKAIAESYKQFGQVKPIVAVAGVVIAGNGQVAAAKSLGWSHLAVVEFADVKKARAFALADNRTSELDVSWDTDRLAQSLAEIGDLSLDLDSLGFGSDDLLALLDADDPPAEPESPSGRNEPSPERQVSDDLQYKIMVDCGGEHEQAELLVRLESEGLTCKAMII